MLTTTLGLKSVHPKQWTYLHVHGQGGGECWHYYDYNTDKRTPEPNLFLTGYLVGIEYAPHNEKLRIFIQADIKYVVQVGISSLFSKTFLRALGNADPSQPITINPVRGESKAAVFCNLYQNDKTVPKIDREPDPLVMVEYFANEHPAPERTYNPQDDTKEN